MQHFLEHVVIEVPPLDLCFGLSHVQLNGLAKSIICLFVVFGLSVEHPLESVKLYLLSDREEHEICIVDDFQPSCKIVCRRM